MLFSHHFQYSIKIWKSKMVVACDVIWYKLLPWKLIRYHVVSLNLKYKGSSLYVLNLKSVGWMVSKVDELGPIWTPPPPPPLYVFV